MMSVLHTPAAGILAGFSLLALVVTATASDTPEKGGSLGPFAVDPAVSLYIVAPPLREGRIAVNLDANSGKGARTMVRVFDPQERLLARQYFEAGRNNPVEGGGQRHWQVPITESGVYQVRVTSGGGGLSAPEFSVEVPGGAGYGVSFQNGLHRPWPGQPSVMYLYVPPKAEELLITGGPLRIFDETGASLYSSDENKAGFENATRIPVARPEVVWRVEFPDLKNWQLKAAGFPFILCPTQETARILRASVEVLPDGTVVAHQFQRRIAGLLPGLLAREKIGSTQELVQLANHFGDDPEAWLAEPLRNELLLGRFFPSVTWALQNQNLDPGSHWSGSIGAFWQRQEKAAPPANRWDRHGSFRESRGTSSQPRGASRILTDVALLKTSFNPWYGRKELFYRAAASALRDLMTLGEDEVWPLDQTSLYAGGGRAFDAAGKIYSVYGAAAPHMPEEVRQVWTDGLRHLTDRAFPDPLVSCRNQSAHYLPAYQWFADGSGDPFDRRQAQSYARRFIDGQSRAGYGMEAYGPDGSYNGLTHYFMACYYRLSGDPAMRDALQKSYRFFNHTVAPEPDGRLLGGFSFNHRIGSPFSHEQGGGALGLVDASIPEVGFRAPRRDDAAREAAIRRIKGSLHHFPHAPVPGWNRLPRYLYWEEPDRNTTWPALERDSFERNFAGELLAVKRPAYYAVLYTGTPSKPFSFGKREAALRKPLPEDAENQGGLVPYNTGKIVPFVGGGAALFWTPEYGAALLAANWSPLTHHGLVGVSVKGERYWEAYARTATDLNHLPERLIVRGVLENHPLSYERTYWFHDNALETELIVTATGDLHLQSLKEIVPLAAGPAKAEGSEVAFLGPASKPTGASLRDTHGNGADLVLETPAEIGFVREGLRSERLKLQISRLEISLPDRMKKGEMFRLKYRLVPVKGQPAVP